MLAVAVGWDVYVRTGDVVALGIVGLCTFFPILLFSIPAGLAADRFDRRFVLTLSLVAQGAATVWIGLWLIWGDAGLWPVYAAMTLVGTANAFFNPALNSALPRIVPREVFANAVASSSSISRVGQLIGPVGGGLLLSAGGQLAYAVTSLMFLVAAVTAALIRADLRITEREPLGVAMLFAGFRFIWNTPKVLGAISIDLIAVLFGTVVGILPAVAVDILGVGADGLGILRAAPAVGAFTVALYLAMASPTWHQGRAFFAALTVFSLSMLVFAFSRSFVLSVAALFVYGMADLVSVYVRQTLIQLDTPDMLRGRVSAANAIAAGGSGHLGDFRAGMMAGLVGIPVAIAAGGLITLAATLIWWRMFPALRNLDRFWTEDVAPIVPAPAQMGSKPGA